MRPEIKEYNFDWILWATFTAASKITNSHDKETQRAMRYVPYFKDAFDALLAEGQIGVKLVKMIYEYVNNIKNAHSQGKKLGVTTFCFSPTIFYALDIVPITFEVVSALASILWKRSSFDYMDFCNEVGFSETGCSSQRGTMGAYLAGLAEEIDFIVCDTPGVCDTNANAYAFLAAYLNKPFYQLNFPTTLTENRSTDYHLADYKNLIKFLEEQTGKTLDQDHLKQILEEIKIQDQLTGALEDMQQMIPNPLPPIYNLIVYLGRFLFAGEKIYTELLQEMVTAGRQNVVEGKSGLRSGKEKLRAFFIYIDHYMHNLTMWQWLDQQGICHVGNILSKFFSDDAVYAQNRQEETYSIKTSGINAMINSIAQINSRLPMVRSIRGPYDAPHMWLDDVLSLAKIYQADCLIYNGTPGCRNTWCMVKPMARDTEKAGYPIQIMYGDAFDGRIESWQATSARLTEFLTVRQLI